MRIYAPSVSKETRRGSAVALALVVVTVVAGFAVAFLRISTSATARQTSEVENLRAFYLAEAGLAESFQALRIGRTGQIGSETEPAGFGQGLLWVDAVEIADKQVRLESTALVGRGRATLALIVEPVNIPLGFFSDETLVIDTVVLTDGYDSEIGSYEEQLIANEITVDPSYPFLYDDTKSSLVFFEGHFYHYTDKSGYTYTFDYDDSPSTSSEVDYRFTDGVEWPGLRRWQDAFRSPEYSRVQDHFAALVAQDASSEAIGAMGPTTGQNALLSSNQDVTFVALAEGEAQIFGDVIPGPDGSANGLNNVTITGEVESRPEAIGLQDVVVPDVAMIGPVVHNKLLPMTVSPGTSGYERIEVAEGAELILRGPSTVVIGELILNDGATLTLDTRDGDVELYVTGGMDLQPGSITSTTGESPDEVSVQIAAIPSTPDGPPIKLDSTAQFRGTIYSPQADVYVGSNFEVYGSVVAKKLTIGPGARLHFDESGFKGSPIPVFVSWKIVEIKSAARDRSRNLFKALKIDPTNVPDLSKAHDLGKVYLELVYVAKNGAKQSYSGTEDGFDWDLVKEIVSVSRDATRQKGAEARPAPKEPAPKDPTAPAGVRQEVYDSILAFDGSNMEALVVVTGATPLSAEEWNEILTRSPPVAPMTVTAIQMADRMAGGTEGP